jgi:hypothetical protein
MLNRIRRWFFCEPHNVEVAKLREQLSRSRASERHLWEENLILREEMRRAKIAQSSTESILMSVLDGTAVITPYRIGAPARKGC